MIVYHTHECCVIAKIVFNLSYVRYKQKGGDNDKTRFVGLKRHAA